MQIEKHRGLPFWPHEQDKNGVEDSTPKGKFCTEDWSSPVEVGLIIATMPYPKARGYFGPCWNRPTTVPNMRAPMKIATSISPLTVGARTSIGGEDCFPAFNPKIDNWVGHFVTLSIEQEELRASVPFYMGKVLEFKKKRWAEKMKVIWYWPCFGIGMQAESASNIAWYENCMEAQWEPSHERHDWVTKKATIFS